MTAVSKMFILTNQTINLINTKAYIVKNQKQVSVNVKAGMYIQYGVEHQRP